MSARHPLRLGRLGRGPAPIDATPVTPVGETLQQARERNGVDLYRAERETKIRLHYLAALEDSAYDELPAAVYTKGFLRNYAIYLGLDPDDLLERWREEQETRRASELIAVAPPPQPIAAPSAGFTIRPGMFVAGLVGVVVLLFVGYIVLQLVRFVEVTPLTITEPSNALTTIDAEQTELRGTSLPHARISIRGPSDELYTAEADDEGEWVSAVSLARGQNTFTIVATDRETDRPSPPAQVIINRPLPVQTVAPTQSVTPEPLNLTMTLAGPAEGSISTDGNVVVRGSTSGSRVTVESRYLGPPSQQQPPASPDPDASPSAEPTPTPSDPPSPDPSASAEPIGPAREVDVSATGAFSETIEFPIGRWELKITAFGAGVAPISELRTISVEPPFQGAIDLIITIGGRQTNVRARADGGRVSGLGTLRPGTVRTLHAVSELCVRTNNAGNVALNLNGLDLGVLGGAGEAGSWVFRPGQGPEPTDDAC